MRRFGIAILVGVLAVAACGNSGEEAEGPSGDDRPGVSDDSIKVGGVAGITNPLGGPYGDVFEGAEAYFEIVNEDGGVHGREIDLIEPRDDATQASRNASQVRALVEQEGVFAVLPVATISFAGAQYLADKGVPTFGWNINEEWSAGPSLFGEKTSYLCIDCPYPYLPYIASTIGRPRVAVLAYTASQSATCAEGQRKSFEEYGDAAGAEIVYEDSALSFGFTPGDIAPDIDAMRERGVQLLSTCMDGAGSGRLARAIREAGLDIVQYLPNGYDPAIAREFGDVLEGSFTGAAFTPFEVEDPPEGLRRYLDAMEDQDRPVNELSLAGWINADLFVTGLEAAGEDFTRQSLVGAINEMTDYTADGILPGIDWTIEHEAQNPDDCSAFVRFSGGEFIPDPDLSQPGKPFLCFNLDDVDLDNPTFR